MSFLIRLLLVVGTLTYLALRQDGHEPARELAGANVERLRTDAQALVGRTAERLGREAAAREVAKFAAPQVGQGAPAISDRSVRVR